MSYVKERDYEAVGRCIECSALERVGQGIEALRTARIESAVQLTAMLEPFAKAMAALTDETRETMLAIAQQSPEQSEQLRIQIETASSAWSKASSEARQAAQNLEAAGRQTERRQ